ncbi:MAG: DNA-3-methyladenine glycosylase [Thermodesulfobacteriota bacterium]
MTTTKPEIVTLSFHPPFDITQVNGFLNPRAIPGVEYVDGDIYSRTIAMDNASGFFTASFPEADQCVRLEIHFPDHDKLSLIADIVKRIFDLEAPAKKIDSHLKKDGFLSNLVVQRPGIRVPGSFNAFELCIRAIVGQQISVKGATTLIGRIAAGYGKKLSMPNPFGLKYLFPGPEKLANVDFRGIGLTNARITTIHHLSTAVLDGRISFHAAITPSQLRKALLEIKGIGEWTAQYILMRTIKHPDAMPCSDLGLLKAVSSDKIPATEKQLRDMSAPWQPWRAYAAMHLWSSLTDI